mmetsp:Transcript_79383/g.145010  ORF Transcript_79383/g.145010 Transcript_79383/m.145010 type:complete len:107 (+) Transcript_79383:851-1171(+)
MSMTSSIPKKATLRVLVAACHCTLHPQNSNPIVVGPSLTSATTARKWDATLALVQMEVVRSRSCAPSARVTLGTSSLTHSAKRTPMASATEPTAELEELKVTLVSP